MTNSRSLIENSRARMVTIAKGGLDFLFVFDILTQALAYYDLPVFIDDAKFNSITWFAVCLKQSWDCHYCFFESYLIRV